MSNTKHKSNQIKKIKHKLNKLIESDSDDNDNNIHELSYYINDRVKLMKEVLKIIKSKKIKSMAPDCIKSLDIEEINTMLFEELLGISNKRLKYIFNAQNLDEDTSSSTDPENETNIDVISLDDVSDDDFEFIDNDKKSMKNKKIKKENLIDNKNNIKNIVENDNLMNVLELLELQARARAIRSQLLLEAEKKSQTSTNSTNTNNHNDDNLVNHDSDKNNDDDIIIEIPKNDEIIINSSDSDDDNTIKRNNITLIDNIINTNHTNKNEENQLNKIEDIDNENIIHNESTNDNDVEIVINVDHEEMASIIEN